MNARSLNVIATLLFAGLVLAYPSAAAAANSIISTESLSGPTGGLLAAAFGAGCIGGYGFCVRTILKISNGRIAALEAEVTRAREETKEERAECGRAMEALRQRQRELEDMLLGRRPIGHFTPLAETAQPDRMIDEQLRDIDEADRSRQRRRRRDDQG